MNACKTFSWAKRAGRLDDPAFLLHLERCAACAHEFEMDDALTSLAGRRPLRSHDAAGALEPRDIRRAPYGAAVPLFFTAIGFAWVVFRAWPQADGMNADLVVALAAAIVTGIALRRSA